VDQVTAGGILWVNSAGNEADAHYRATFTDTDGNGYHEFSAGDELLEVHPYGGRITFVLNWDAWKTGDQNLDLYLYDADSKEIASSYNVQSGPGDDAAEIIIFESPGKGPYYIGFYASKVTRPVVLDFFVGGEGGEIEYTTVEHSVLTPADARGAFTVGAVRWDTDVLEGFSSQGPSNDGRLKPEISAPDRVSSAVYGEAFPGTSAAAPHVAGAAALVWQAFPGYSAQQVTEYLKTNAVDLGPSGPDNAYGYGRLYLGDVPGAGFSPEPTTTGVVAPVRTEAPPTSTATGPVAGTQTPAATATVKRMETATPRPQPGGNVSLWPLALLACVVMPGFLGLGGIGLLGGVWYWNRSRRAARPPVAPIAGTQVAPQVPGGQNTPDQQRCPRCGNPHRPQAKFCSYCGLVLRLGEAVVRAPQYCVRCGQALRPGSKFCPLCGRSR
jgi:subtilisin family serine protease/ribosomal protein L37E